MANGLTTGSGLPNRSAAGSQPGAGPAATHHGPGSAPAWLAVPRCTLRFEKLADGFKVHCECPDQAACGTLHNLCRSLAGGMCSCTCTKNGICVAQCNLCFGNCSCEPTPNGICITCRSGDKDCCGLIQGCCECLASCCQAGCACTISLGGVPICCGSYA